MAKFLHQGGGQDDVYDDIIQQPTQVRPPPSHLAVGNAAIEDEPKYEEINTDSQADRSTTTQRKLTARDRIYGRILETMYMAAVNQPDEESPKIKEVCADCCCYSAICINKIDCSTAVLRRAREMGWKLYGHIAFPLMRNNLRQFLVYSELVIILAVLVLSIVTYLRGRNAVFDVVFLLIAIIGSLLAAMDTIFCLCTGCRVLKTCRRNNGGRTEERKCQSTDATITEVSRMSDVEAAKSDREQRRMRTNAKVNKVDVLRLVVTELVLYPLLMCSLFKLIIGEAYMYKFNTLDDSLSFVLFLIVALSFGIYVYIVRLWIIVGVVYKTHKIRKPPPQLTASNNCQFDSSISKSANRLQAYLIYHTVAQIMLQVLMIIATAARIRYDNQNIIQSGNMNEELSVGYYLWIMLISAYVIPVFGHLSFFIVTFYWIQEFPVGLCVDLTAILQTHGITLSSGLPTTITNYKEKITTYLNIAELKKEFTDIQNSSFIDKVCYPLLSPTMVILCMVFTGLQIAFIISIPREDFSFAGGEIIIYIAIVCFSIANIFTLIIFSIWIAIIIIVVAVVLLVFAVIAGLVAMAVYLGIIIIPKCDS